ncbi:MAG: hypothetical protein ACQEQE_10870 [Bacillota bacterium]
MGLIPEIKFYLGSLFKILMLLGFNVLYIAIIVIVVKKVWNRF